MINRPYIFYGSKNSIDTDAIMFFNENELPKKEEDRKRFNRVLRNENPHLNLMFAVIKDGIIIDCLSPTAPDGLNNAILSTYKNHEQIFDCPVLHRVKRNKALNIYNCIHLINTMIARTHYRELIRPSINWHNSFKEKVEKLKTVDFSTITDFNQKNICNNEDIWKKICFYLGQSFMLVKYDIEIYDKNTMIENNLLTKPFMNREKLDEFDIHFLNNTLKIYLDLILSKNINQYEEILTIDNQSCNMKKFKPIEYLF
jgi:hypothetical protein